MSFNPWNKCTLFYRHSANWIYVTLPSQIPVCSWERLSHCVCLHHRFGFSRWNKSRYKQQITNGRWSGWSSAYVKRIYLSNSPFAAKRGGGIIDFFKWGCSKIDIARNMKRTLGKQVLASLSNFIRYSPVNHRWFCYSCQLQSLCVCCFHQAFTSSYVLH